MKQNPIIKIIMKRDMITLEEARWRMYQAQNALDEYLASGDLESAENICEEFFGLEPDYLDYMIY